MFGNIRKEGLLLSLIIVIGIFLRFYNLNWGSPFYFHPDERNIASSITQLNFPQQMNPHFFAYGSLPIYSIYLGGILWNIVSNIGQWQLIPDNIIKITQVSFETAILISRFYSFIFSVITLVLLYKLGELLKNKNTAFLSVLLASISTGFIQYSHFGTFETWLSYSSTILFLLLIKYVKSRNTKYYIFSSIALGILISIKISSLVLILPLIMSLIIVMKQKYKFFSKKSFLFFIKYTLLLVVISSIIYLILSPYTIMDFTSFKSSINYESSVVIGTLSVFYTGGFYNTTPVLFQLTKIYPFLINPLVTIVFISSFIYLTFKTIKDRNALYFLLLSFFLTLFLSQALFFAKWTRNMVPTLPFIYLIVAISITDLLSIFKNSLKSNFLYKCTRTLIIGFVITVSFAFTISYFLTVYVANDTRILALNFAKKNIPDNMKILSEIYDLGITPFNRRFQNIDLFDFYNLENNFENEKLLNKIHNYEYIILPSQRILRSRITNPEKFPNGNKFYNLLLSEKIGFKKIYETPCDVMCRIIYLGNPVFSFEETASVFDRPTIFIFKNSKGKTINQSLKLLRS